MTPLRRFGVEETVSEGRLEIADSYQRFGPMVLRRCRRLLRNEGHAVDAMHDVFVQLLRTRPERVTSSLLYRIATHVCLNRLRTARRRPEDAEDALVLEIAHADSGLESRWSARSLLEAAFGNSQESTRTIAVLHLLDGLSLEEVAREVGMSVSGVRKRLRLLKAQLERIGAEA